MPLTHNTVTCIDESVYSGALTYGQKYAMLAVSDDQRTIYLRADHGHKQWYPVSCFDLSGADVPRIDQIMLRDSINHPLDALVEVNVTLTNGQRRWCHFAMPASFTRFGYVLEGTTIHLHYGAHLLILTEISTDLIRRALDRIERQGKLMTCTGLLDDDQDDEL